MSTNHQPLISSSRPAQCAEARAARLWLGMAVGVLMLAGVFALFLVVGRMPPFDRLVTDPLFFRRALVVHVNLSLVLWFYSFVACLLFLLPGGSAWWSRGAVWLSAAGVAVMAVATAEPGVEPVLSNYIPMLDSGLFATGQLAFAVGVLVSFLDRRLLPWGAQASAFYDLPSAACVGLRAAAVALLVAATTAGVSWLTTPVSLSTEAYYEMLFWGVGHVLQLASAVAMIAVWLILVTAVVKRPVVGGRAATVLFAILLMPWLSSPALAVLGTTTATFRVGHTQLMRWSIFPVTLVFLALCLRALASARRERNRAAVLSDPRVAGFAISVALTLLGFCLGAMIRGGNTMVPAHYHASIGGVTAAFMAVTYVLLEPLGLRLRGPRMRRLAAWQPALFGVGQMVFASGFAVAGAYGAARKAYGPEQAGRSLAESLGLGVMGIGGLVAAAGGLLFLFLVASAWRRRDSTTVVESFTLGTRRHAWNLENRA